MKNRRNILTNASVYILGSFFTQGLTFITLPLFSRLMEPADYGLYSSYNFWIAIVGIVLGLQFSASIGNAVVDFGKEKIYSYISSAISLGFITFLGLLGVTIILQTRLSDFFEVKPSALIIGVVQCFFIYCLNCLTASLRFLEKPFAYIALCILNATINIVLSIILLFSIIKGELYMGRVYSSLIAAIVSGGISLILIIRKKEAWIEISYWKYGLLISVPLIFHSIAGLVFARIDQMIILKLADASSAGVYGYSNSIGQIISVLYTALNQAFVPWYYMRMKDKEIEKVKKVGKIYINTFTGLTLIIMMIIPEVITIISDEKYYSAVYIVPILFGSYFMNYIYTFPVNYEFFLKKTTYIAVGTVVSMLFNIILDILLIPVWGGTGAAVATLISYLFLFVLHYIIARYVIKGYEFSIMEFAVNIFVVGITLILYYVCLDKILVRYMIVLLLIVVAVFFIKKSRIKK